MNVISLHQLTEPTGVQFGTSGARGLVAQMSDSLCYAYAQAFLRTVATHPGAVVIGHDLRPSSPTIAAACAQAVHDAGREVVFVGAMPTPAIAFYAADRNAASLVVTGSHIPFDRNGIKFYRSTGEISKDDERAMLAAAVELVPEGESRMPLPPVDQRAIDAYVRRYTDFFAGAPLSGMRVALYEHSSVARDVLPRILEALGAEVLSLGRTDEFVPIDTEAVRPEDVARAKQWAAEYDFDALISTDGDADRPLIGDERGNWLRGDVVGVLCSEYLGITVVTTPVSSNTVVEQCREFRQVIRTRIGSPYVIAAMEAAQAPGELNDVVAGYEANGGFLLGSDIVRNGVRLAALPTRDAVLPILALLCMAKQRGCKVSELSAHLPARFTFSDRLQNFPAEKSQALIALLAADLDNAARFMAPAAGAVVDSNTIDGLRLRFANGDIVHLRASGNAPELRCYAEAGSMVGAERLCRDCLARIEG